MGKYILILWLLSPLLAHAQEADTHYKSTPAKELLKLAKQYDFDAIAELGKRRDRSALGLLNKIAAEPNLPEQPNHANDRIDLLKNPVWRRNRSHIESRIALARMGEQQYFDEFMVGLSSSNLQWRSQCIHYLGKVGDKRAVKLLAPILYEKTLLRDADFDSIPFSGMAAHALGQILPDVQCQIEKETCGNRFSGPSPEPWKAWWQVHKNEYEKP